MFLLNKHLGFVYLDILKGFCYNQSVFIYKQPKVHLRWTCYRQLIKIMISIIATGGKQYIVKSGEKLKVEKLKNGLVDAAEGSEYKFDKVLLKADEEGNLVEIGKPYLEGEAVKAKVLKQGKTRTLRVEKFKSKVRFHKVHGQRQRFTEVEIA